MIVATHSTRSVTPEFSRFLRPAFFALIGATLMLPACSWQKAQWQSGWNPGLRMQVERVVARGDYLAAVLAARDFSIEVYLPANESCRTLFVEGAEVEYREGAPGGVYKKDDLECLSSGIGTLREWRNRRPRPRTSGSIVERGLAIYRVVYQDDEVAFLRGQFPLTGMIGFVGLGDTIAVVSKVPQCEGPIARENSSIEYYHTGKKVFTLVSAKGQCPIIGFITPSGPERL